MFLPPRTSVPRQPTTQDHSDGTPPTRRACRHNISNGTSQPGKDKSSRASGSRTDGIWTLATSQHFLSVKVKFRSEVARGSTRPTPALQWFTEVEQSKVMNHLATSSSIPGIAVGDFETLDSKIASGFIKILHGDIRTRVFNEEEEKQSRLLTGRQSTWMICGHFMISDTDYFSLTCPTS